MKRCVGKVFGSNKGQAAIEYMMIISISLILLIPLFSLVNSYTARGKDELKIRALEDSVDSLSEAVDMVYFQGYPAKMSVSFYIPESVLITNVTGNLIRVRLRTSSGIMDVTTLTQANITGSIPTDSGTYKIKIKAEESGVVNVTY